MLSKVVLTQCAGKKQLCWPAGATKEQVVLKKGTDTSRGVGCVSEGLNAANVPLVFAPICACVHSQPVSHSVIHFTFQFYLRWSSRRWECAVILKESKSNRQSWTRTLVIVGNIVAWLACYFVTACLMQVVLTHPISNTWVLRSQSLYHI